MLHSSNYALMWYCSIIFTDRNNFHFAKACWVSCKHHSLPKITNNNIRMLNTKYVYVFWWLISWFCQLAIQASTTSKQCILKYIGHNNNTKKGRQHQILYILSKSIENIKIQLWLEVKYLRSLSIVHTHSLKILFIHSNFNLLYIIRVPIVWLNDNHQRVEPWSWTSIQDEVRW